MVIINYKFNAHKKIGQWAISTIQFTIKLYPITLPSGLFQETMDTGDEYEVGDSGEPDDGNCHAGRRPRCRRKKVHHSTVVNPDSNLYFYWLLIITCCVLYNLWTLIVRQSFPELQENGAKFWFFCDYTTDTFIVLDILVQFRTGYLEQGNNNNNHITYYERQL